jgi:hypothetical protein
MRATASARQGRVAQARHLKMKPPAQHGKTAPPELVGGFLNTGERIPTRHPCGQALLWGKLPLWDKLSSLRPGIAAGQAFQLAAGHRCGASFPACGRHSCRPGLSPARRPTKPTTQPQFTKQASAPAPQHSASPLPDRQESRSQARMPTPQRQPELGTAPQRVAFARRKRQECLPHDARLGEGGSSQL